MYLPTQLDGIVLYRLEVEADETWSFVGKKANCQWIWLALDATTRQVIAFHVGDRSRQSAQQLLQNIPEVYRHSATFHTDLYAVYQGVIPSAQHRSHIRTVQLLSLQHLRIFVQDISRGNVYRFGIAAGKGSNLGHIIQSNASPDWEIVI